jgi:hypothetical protein
MKTLGVVIALLAVGILGSLVFETPTQAASSNPSVTIANVPLPVTVGNSSSNPVPIAGLVTDANAGKYTQVGQKPAQVVNLVFHSVDTNFFVAPFRINPATGSAQSTQFEVPAGFVFVLTNVQGRSVCRPGIVHEFYLYQTTSSNGQQLRDWSGELTPKLAMAASTASQPLSLTIQLLSSYRGEGLVCIATCTK